VPPRCRRRGQVVDRARRAHAGQGADFVHQPLVERGRAPALPSRAPATDTIIVRTLRGPGRGRGTAGPAAGGSGAGARRQHERERELGEPRAGCGAGSVPPSVERRSPPSRSPARRGARPAARGRGRRRCPAQRDRGHEREHAAVEAHRLEPRDVGGRGPQGADAEPREGDASEPRRPQAGGSR
jgi:hypothetical protein